MFSVLFNIALEYKVRSIIETNKLVKIDENTKLLTIAAYADDIMIVAESETNLKKQQH